MNCFEIVPKNTNFIVKKILFQEESKFDVECNKLAFFSFLEVEIRDIFLFQEGKTNIFVDNFN